MAIDPFVGEITVFAGNFAPTGWATCDGQLLPISQNTALFSILGTTYGGDGKSNFALPNLRGCSPMHPGTGPGLSQRSLGETGGTETVTLTAQQLPAHSHTAMTADAASAAVPGAGVALAVSAAGNVYRSPGVTTTLAPETIQAVGGNLPHENRQPYLTLTFIIALQGVFPPRS
jgi:microcystin-dependent protein